MEKLDRWFFWVLIFLAFCAVFSILIVAFDRIFVLFSPPRVVNLLPPDGASDIPLNSNLVINFDKPVKRQEIKPSIFPEVPGEWKFETPLIKNHFFKTLVFIPAIEFEAGNQYQVKIENIKGFGLEKSNSFQFSFRTYSNPQNDFSGLEITETKPKITMLEISMDWQDYPLSCEAASLKMALAGKGIFVSENEIMEEIGYDETEHRGNIWGNPYEKYVGEISGKICETGYGVYWKPVAKAGNKWRPSESFSGGTLDFLLNEIKLGNPVVVWGVLPVDNLHDCSWNTPEGEYVKAFKETHVRLAVGFIEEGGSPSKIILNDPLTGRLYWPTNYFLENWKVFNYSGVVIR